MWRQTGEMKARRRRSLWHSPLRLRSAFLTSLLQSQVLVIRRIVGRPPARTSSGRDSLTEVPVRESPTFHQAQYLSPDKTCMLFLRNPSEDFSCSMLKSGHDVTEARVQINTMVLFVNIRSRRMAVVLRALPPRRTKLWAIQAECRSLVAVAQASVAVSWASTISSCCGN